MEYGSDQSPPAPHKAGNLAERPARPALGCLSALLAAFILFFGCGGLIARIDPGEFAGTAVVDILVGLAVFGFLSIRATLNADGRTSTGATQRYLLPAIAAVASAAVLIGWHWFIVWARESASR